MNERSIKNLITVTCWDLFVSIKFCSNQKFKWAVSEKLNKLINKLNKMSYYNFSLQ